MHTLNLRSFLWFATGVALTVTSVATFGAWRADAAVTEGESTFVPITPCRLFDTRAGGNNVGTRSTPLAQTDVVMKVTGTNGECIIPTDATAVAMNLTAVNPTANSFLQAFPSDVTRPEKGSNLNFTAGQSPVPNKVDVKLGATGAIKLFNSAGNVNAIADIVGYYKSSTVSQLSADIAALQTTVTRQQADIKSLLEDTNVIPSGVTVTGFEVWDSTSVADGEEDSFVFELPGRTPVRLTNLTVNFAEDFDPRTIDDDEFCTGNSGAPTAPPGKVCLYVANIGAADTFEGNSISTDRHVQVIFNTDSASNEDYYVSLAWAYTAP